MMVRQVSSSVQWFPERLLREHRIVLLLANAKR